MGDTIYRKYMEKLLWETYQTITNTLDVILENRLSEDEVKRAKEFFSGKIEIDEYSYDVVGSGDYTALTLFAYYPPLVAVATKLKYVNLILAWREQEKENADGTG